MATPVTLTGGHFQDAIGNVLANGYLKMKLSQDGSVSGSGNIASGVELTITLDVNGNIGSNQSVWGNDQILPVNTFYRVTGYTAQGQIAWGPNNQQVIGNGGTFDVGASWTPNTVISWSPSLQAFSPAGMNVIVTPSGPATTGGTPDNSPMPGSATVWANFSPGGTTHSVCFYTPASSILIPCSSWKCSVYQGSATANLAIKMCIYKCAPGTLTILATTNITFGGTATPSWTGQAQTIHTSDTMSFAITPAFDYYFVCDCTTNQPYLGQQGTNAVGATGAISITNTDNYGLAVSSSLSFASIFANQPYSLLVNWIAQS